MSKTDTTPPPSAEIIKLKLSRQATYRLAERLIEAFTERWNRPL